jgi:hypothetical protein
MPESPADLAEIKSSGPSLADALAALRGNAPSARQEFVVSREIDTRTDPWTEQVTTSGATLEDVIAHPRQYRLREYVSLIIDDPAIPPYRGERRYLGDEEYERRRAELAEQAARDLAR